jgi:hypothetical protein
MKKVVYVLVFFLIALGCSKDSNDPVTESVSDSENLITRGHKVDVCHRKGNGEWHVINISQNALPAHLAHGDVLLEDNDGDGFVAELNECVPGGDCDDNDPTTYPGAEELCGDGIDNDCDGDVDEDCCPYFSVADILAIAADINYFNQFGDGCLTTEDSVVFYANSCNFGLSYDVAVYGDTIIVDPSCNSYFGDSVAILNVCEDVLLAAQAILNAPSLCGSLQSGTASGNRSGAGGVLSQ